jgi:hypothetical protein
MVEIKDLLFSFSKSIAIKRNKFKSLPVGDKVWGIIFGIIFFAFVLPLKWVMNDFDYLQDAFPFLLNYACSEQLYQFGDLVKTAEKENNRFPCLLMPHHDQAGMNLLVHLSRVDVVNLTLPPVKMQSTWAGDYTDADYERYWKEEAGKPYLIHWAGCPMDVGRPLDRAFLQYLTEHETDAWNMVLVQKNKPNLWKKTMRNISILRAAMRNAPLEC